MSVATRAGPVLHWLPLPIAVILVVGCARVHEGEPLGEAASATTASASPATATVVERARTVRPRHRRGLAGMMFHAVHDLPLSPAEDVAIDDLEDHFLGTDDGGDGGLGGFEADVVAGIRAGKIDAMRMRADYAGIDRLAKTRREREAAALGALHDTLDGGVRESLVVLVRARRAAHALRPPDSPDEGAADWTERRLDRLTDDLGLDAAQRLRVAALLAKSQLPTAATVEAREGEAKERADAFLAAFAKEAFDASVLDLPEPGKSPHEWIEHEVRFLSSLLPVLTPDQRDKLAASRQRRAPAGPDTPL
jgi:hypothetical protein